VAVGGVGGAGLVPVHSGMDGRRRARHGAGYHCAGCRCAGSGGVAMEERKEVLRYYLQELAYVRRMGREFAREYPKVAARLELSDGVSSDPHVERLIESFAFLTARLERRLELELPEISTALLGVLYPSLANPVPPLAIARFSLEPSGQRITSA